MCWMMHMEFHCRNKPNSEIYSIPDGVPLGTPTLGFLGNRAALEEEESAEADVCCCVCLCVCVCVFKKETKKEMYVYVTSLVLTASVFQHGRRGGVCV